jgi:hypothetical protein
MVDFQSLFQPSLGTISSTQTNGGTENKLVGSDYGSGSAFIPTKQTGRGSLAAAIAPKPQPRLSSLLDVPGFDPAQWANDQPMTRGLIPTKADNQFDLGVNGDDDMIYRGPVGPSLSQTTNSAQNWTKGAQELANNPRDPFSPEAQSARFYERQRAQSVASDRHASDESRQTARTMLRINAHALTSPMDNSPSARAQRESQGVIGDTSVYQERAHGAPIGNMDLPY